MNREIEFYDKLKEIIIKNVLAVSSAEVDEMYDYWELNKDKKEIKNFKFPDTLIHINQEIPTKGATLKGIDLPTWFGNYSKKKVMILGIDPLRNEKVFERECAKENNQVIVVTTDVINYSIKNDVIIGTPYALHEFKAREGSCAVYWNFIKWLSENHFVYCTDIFKTYYYNTETNKRSYRDLDFPKSENHKELLTLEINLIKPDVIIAFGNLVEKLLNDLKLSTSIIKLPHPSGANRKWNKIITGEDKREQKVEHLKSLIINELM
jgi:hypothetical protein